MRSFHHVEECRVHRRTLPAAESAGDKEMKIVMASLDDAGKTTILYRMMLDTAVTATLAVGFHVESVEHRSLELTVWDIGGQEG